MNIFHAKCKSSVYVELPARILATFGIGKKNLQMGLAYIELPGQTNLYQTKFFCNTCDESVEISDLRGLCSYCGKTFTTDNLYRLTDSGGNLISDVTCKECISRYELSFVSKITLAETMEKFIPKI